MRDERLVTDERAAQFEAKVYFSTNQAHDLLYTRQKLIAALEAMSGEYEPTEEAYDTARSLLNELRNEVSG